MNKYQEALENAVDCGIISKDWKVLKELVDKATPKKPKIKAFNEAEPWDCADYFVERNACPACERKMINKSDFCPNCGQAIDWSTDDE